MENQAIKPEKLGAKTFIIFLIKHLPLLIIFIFLLAAAISVKPYIPYNYAQYGNWTVSGLVAIILIIALIDLLATWLEFIRYKIFITPDSIKINRGILSEEQIGIPFRRLQDATIKRGIFYQLIGASSLVLNILGEEGSTPLTAESRIVLPALDKDLALKIQDVILKKAEVEEMSMEPVSPPAAQ
jgi:uncharacterized membrane protein YdbT with pleckstrin-like domain